MFLTLLANFHIRDTTNATNISNDGHKSLNAWTGCNSVYINSIHKASDLLVFLILRSVFSKESYKRLDELQTSVQVTN